MKPKANFSDLISPRRRNFLGAAAAVSVGAGLSGSALITPANALDKSDILTRDQDLKFFGIEETYSTEELMTLNAINDEHRQFLKGIGLADLGPGRIAAMDAAGLNVAILSAHTPGAQDLPREEGIDLAYRLNKMIATGPIATNPTRYLAFATLPLQDPAASADELERAVREDGFVGAMTNGFIGTKFLDHPDFGALLARAEALNVPIYLHPGYPPKEVLDIYYRTSHNGEDTEFQDYLFSGSGYGWHQEVLTQSLRMILTGVFDKFPKLQVIIGHMGEGLPFFYKRFEEEFTEVTEGTLLKPILQYFSDNFWFTTSAFPQDELLHLLLRYISVDRVMFATDYPFADMKQQTDWFRAVDLTREDKEKIAFRNAEKLFGFTV